MARRKKQKDTIEENFNKVERKKQKREAIKKRIRLIAKALVVFLIILVVFIFVNFVFKLKSVEVIGNELYSDQEVISQFMTKSIDKNSFGMYFHYKFSSDSKKQFNDYKIKLSSPRKVIISVEEKEIKFGLEQDGKYIYLDESGNILKVTNEDLNCCPIVTGLKVSKPIAYEKANVQNSIFENICKIIESCEDLKRDIKQIDVDKSKQYTVEIDGITIKLGKCENFDEKMAQIPEVLNELEDRSGILFMEDFSEKNDIITFKQNQ